MRFKAVLNDAKGLLGALQVCRSIQRDCIIRLHPQRTRIFSNITVADGVQVWIGCQSGILFTDMICNSSNEEQSITCEVLDLAQLIHIVRQAEVRERARVSSSSSSKVLMRLAKAGQRPLLKVSMDGLAGQPDLCFDVPLRILTDRDIQGMAPPPLEDHRLHVAVPDIAELTTFIDKLKNTAADSVTFSARTTLPAEPRSSTEGGVAGEEEEDEDENDAHGGDEAHTAGERMNGRSREGRRRAEKRQRDVAETLYASLVIYAEHFMARISLKYEAVELLEMPSADAPRGGGGAATENEDATLSARTATATATVETKKFARFFSAVKEISPNKISMYLVNQKALVLSVYAVGHTTMVAYIPAKSVT